MMMIQIERKPKTQAAPFNFGNNKGSIIPFANTSRTQRNDPCPCGQTKIISYLGTTLADREIPVKFKHCHLNEMGPQSNAVKSTKEIIDLQNKKRVKLGLLKPLVNP